jgi:hypothetical protein
MLIINMKQINDNNTFTTMVAEISSTIRSFTLAPGFSKRAREI